MSKKKSRFKFILTGIFVIIGICLCCFRFTIPGTYYDFKGWANSIKLGIDLKGGVVAVYEASLDDTSTASLSDAIDSTISRISSLLTDKGYTEATVTKQGDNRIRVEVPDVDDPQEIFDIIGQPAKLEIKAEKDTDTDVHEAILTGDHIKNVEAGQQDGSYGVSITFNSKGSELFYNLTSEKASSGESIYIYIGGTLFSEPTVNSAISGGTTFISGSMSTLADAESYALKIKSGTFSTNLTVIENSVISATYGDSALIGGIIAGGIALLLIFIFLFVVYKNMGLIADLALCVYCVLLIFFLHAIPLVQLTLPSIAGIILSIGMAVDGNVVIFERIKDEYRSGKKIPASVTAGFKKASVAIFDGNITTILASVVLYILGSGTIKGFAVTLFIGIAISMFTSLVVTRSLLKSALAFNSTKAKSYGLKREEA